MAHSILPHTHENGFRQPAKDPHWVLPEDSWDETGDDAGPQYEVPPSVEIVTSTRHNDLGFNVLRVWPTLHDGTASPHGCPAWWNPRDKVDVLICGAGPSGLEVALSCLRQGLTFRIIALPFTEAYKQLDKNTAPLAAGRADGVQPRFLETLSTWGLATEVHEEGPLIERTAIYHNGRLLHHGRSHQSDSRYRGLHIITQGQIERIFVRDLLRHRVVVERATTLKEYSIDSALTASKDHSAYPVQCVIQDGDGKETAVQAKFLVGSDGASSAIRRKLQIPFDGISTDIYWGIMDCIFETDYPHAWIFGSVTGPLAASRQARDPSFAESGGQVDIHSVTPEEVLEQANRIFAPYKLSFAAPLSWFAVWKISERVARSFSSDDQRVHLVGDAAHVHSVMGAFGLNASILDAANLGWKIGLCAKGKADPSTILPTYDRERRLHAANIIEISGKYLRFVCSSQVPTARLHYLGADLGLEERETYKTNGQNGVHDAVQSAPPSSTEAVSITVESDSKDKQNVTAALTRDEAKAFLHDFFTQHGQFLLGVDAEYGTSCLNPSIKRINGVNGAQRAPPVKVKNGVRAPNPRVCFDESHTGYLYDKLPGDGRFHLVIFGSNLLGPVRQRLRIFSEAISSKESTGGFYARFGGAEMFNIVLVAKGTPFEIEENLSVREDLAALRDTATVLADDRAPDEDAHSTWGVNHRTGAVVVIRPDLWVGISAVPDDTEKVGSYFSTFLLA
ncbi:hypothetical protein Asppvi_005388 [Aspergillus pseudoviridinutans]|uniref:FAD binding domain-containing protein n=1 Tax=Aspergillus pseudoviridinutans TaxID=1517512 RepID=A0A9P3ESR3_9EURO|nr:uncharacterized protein Asppvi_005388 [Aspergillus pseudoviridinutans]GIJ86499.1 hypothetical protein Asppvi_005388 [Aspergillus pseudoviridinutans]